jgi:hypothetical protein
MLVSRRIWRANPLGCNGSRDGIVDAGFAELVCNKEAHINVIVHP